MYTKGFPASVMRNRELDRRSITPKFTVKKRQVYFKLTFSFKQREPRLQSNHPTQNLRIEGAFSVCSHELFHNWGRSNQIVGRRIHLSNEWRPRSDWWDSVNSLKGSEKLMEFKSSYSLFHHQPPWSKQKRLERDLKKWLLCCRLGTQKG